MGKSITVIPAKKVQTNVLYQVRKKIKVAAYCRVSTDQEEQLSSYENQVNYYREYISKHEDYELVDIYADEGISATNTKKRDAFNRLIQDCRAGKVDRILVKSISRFARNTLDCIKYVRELKELGVGVTFEKETFYIKSQEEILKNKKHPHCDKLECKLLNRLEDTLVILLLFVKKLNFRHAKNLALEQV